MGDQLSRRWITFFWGGGGGRGRGGGINTNVERVPWNKFVRVFTQCIFDFEIRNKQMFTEARAFSQVTYF